MSKTATYQGRTVDVVEVKGGWTTILDGMKQIKVRNSELAAAKAEKAPKVKVTKTNGKAAPKPAKPARVAKSKDQADEDARLIRADLSRYVVSDVKTASGRKAIDIGDDVASRLRGADLTDVYRAAAEATGQPMAALHRKYDHLNPGMQRMNLGNLIRGAQSKAARAEA